MSEVDFWRYQVTKRGAGNDRDGYFSVSLGVIEIEKAFKLSEEEKMTVARETYPDAEQLSPMGIEWREKK